MPERSVRFFFGLEPLRGWTSWLTSSHRVDRQHASLRHRDRTRLTGCGAATTGTALLRGLLGRRWDPHEDGRLGCRLADPMSRLSDIGCFGGRPPSDEGSHVGIAPDMGPMPCKLVEMLTLAGLAARWDQGGGRTTNEPGAYPSPAATSRNTLGTKIALEEAIRRTTTIVTHSPADRRLESTFAFWQKPSEPGSLVSRLATTARTVTDGPHRNGWLSERRGRTTSRGMECGHSDWAGTRRRVGQWLR